MKKITNLTWHRTSNKNGTHTFLWWFRLWVLSVILVEGGWEFHGSSLLYNVRAKKLQCRVSEVKCWWDESERFFTKMSILSLQRGVQWEVRPQDSKTSPPLPNYACCLSPKFLVLFLLRYVFFFFLMWEWDEKMPCVCGPLPMFG